MKVTGISGAALIAALGLVACGGGGGGGATPSPQPSPPPPPSGTSPSPSPAPGPSATYSLGGSATGLVGSALIIANGGDQLTLTDSADFTFGTALADNDSYAVTIVSQPTNPDRVCTLENATGTVAGADVTNVTITCTGPLALVTTAPVAGDEQVSRAVQPLLTFSADIDAASATAAQFTLESAHRSETFAVSVNGDTVTLAPDAPLLPLTDYTLTIADALRGTAGERPLQSESLTFRTRDGMWSAVESFGAGADAHVAASPDGRAWVAWSTPMGAVREIFVDSFDPATGWAKAPESLGLGSGHRIAMDAAGNATVAWLDAAQNVVVRRYDAALADWSDETTVSGVVADISSLDIGVDPQGHALLLWEQDDAGVRSIGSVYFDGSAWQSPVLVEQHAILAYSPIVRFLADGSAIAAWRQFDDGASHDIAVSRFDVVNGWGAVEILTPTFGDTSSVDFAADPAGNIMAVWRQSDLFVDDIFASYYTPSGGWQTPVSIESQSLNAASPKVVVAPDGSAIAVWKQTVSTSSGNTARVYQNRFTPGSGWAADSAISTVGSANYPRIVIDANGNAICSWWVLDLDVAFDAYSVWANRFTPDNGWTTAEKLHDVNQLIDTNGPRLAIDASGNAIAAWGSSQAGVFASRFE